MAFPVQIFDDGSTIKIIRNGIVHNLDKSTLSISIEGQELVMRDASKQKIFFQHQDVTNIVSTNAEELRSTIEAFKDISGGGISTSAKQDLQIAELQAIKTELKRNAIPVITNIAASLVNVTIAISDLARKQIIIVNDGNNNLFLKYGATATINSYTIKLMKNSTLIEDRYSGNIDGIWDVANGNARITVLKE